jgi:heme exporter protein B
MATAPALDRERVVVHVPPPAHQVRMLRGAGIVAAKDLRIEWGSRVTASQVLPFAGVLLLLFAFALDPDTGSLRRAAPGVFWAAVLLAAILASSRAASLEIENGAIDALRLSRIDSGAVFLGKAVAVAVQLLVLELGLLGGLVAVYGYQVERPLLLVASAVAATTAISAAGVLYGCLAASLRVKDTLLPLLTLPALTPTALGAARAWDAAGGTATDGGRWLQLLTVLAALFVTFGIASYGALVEEG